MIVPGVRSMMAKEEFLERWPASDGVGLGQALLAPAALDRDADGVEYALIVCFSFGFTDELLPISYSLPLRTGTSVTETLSQLSTTCVPPLPGRVRPLRCYLFALPRLHRLGLARLESPARA